MSDTVQRIKEKLSIVEVIQPYVKLTKAGKYWKGLSPFNKEKSPSFFVSPDRGLYHCFSSGKGGDMFTFISEMEGVDFRGALKILADKAGVPLEAERPGERDQKERLFSVLDSAREFYTNELSKRSDATEYLVSRGVTSEMMSEWSLGYAPNTWRSLRDHLTGSGYTEHEIEHAGLIKKPDSPESETQNSKLGTQNSSAPSAHAYDRFRGRIMFPIQDISGRTIAFSGRIFEDDPVHPQAKYINSPETPIFDKSRALFGIERARESIRSLNAAILVEGQFDLLLAHQLGYRNAVATSGTSFTEKHAEVLRHYSDNLLVAYDGDRAGIAAAGRAAALAVPLGMNVKIAKLPPGEDPADLILKDSALFKDAVKNALHVVDFYLAHIADAKYDSRRFRMEVSRTVIPYVAMIPNSIDQAHFVKRIAESLSIPEDAVLSEVKKAISEERRGKGDEDGKNRFSISRSLTPLPTAEPFLSRGDSLERLVFGLWMLFTEATDMVSADGAKKALVDASGKERFKILMTSSDEDKRAAQFEADFFLESYADMERRVEALSDVYTELQRESYHERYRESLRALRVAEGTRDAERAEALMHELASLAPKLQ